MTDKLACWFGRHAWTRDPLTDLDESILAAGYPVYQARYCARCGKVS